MKYNQNCLWTQNPTKPLEANCCTREDDAWPRRECQSAKDGKEETAAATKIGATSGRWRLFTGNIRQILKSVPSSCPILGSYTIHLE